MKKYPVVIVDLSQTSSTVQRAVASRANQVVVVSTPSLPSLRLARSLVHELKDLRGKDDKGIELVINMQGMATSNEVPKKDIEKAMELKISAMISFLPKLFMGSESESKKIIADKDGELVVKMSVLPVLQKVLDADIPQNHGQVVENTGFLSSLMGKLKAKK